MGHWAMRTCRDDEEIRQYIHDELSQGRLRQGWGWDESQNLGHIDSLWANDEPLSSDQQEASRHWRMGNGEGPDYMQVDDLIVVANVPNDGLFTICRITGNYEFNIPEEFEDFGHIRPVEVLTPQGISNDHKLVHADLRRSFRCRSRMWNVEAHAACLDGILESLQSGLAPEELTHGSTADGRAESVVAELITEPLDQMATRLEKALPQSVKAEEWEPVLRSALEQLFPVSVYHTGGAQERGADIEIVIPNPFEKNRDWIVPVQVKDYEGEVPVQVADQLKQAIDSRQAAYRVIAVVLLVSNAKASEGLEARMADLTAEYGVPFMFCGHDRFLRLLARGYLRKQA